MRHKPDNSKSKKKSKPIGPGEDCNCSTCIFSKSQAPGDPYDLSACPKYSSKKDHSSKK